LFIGKYDTAMYFADDVKPFHDQIRELRIKHNVSDGKGNSFKSGYNGANNGGNTRSQGAKRKIKELQKTNDQLQIHLSAVQASLDKGKAVPGIKQDEDAKPNVNAGNSFGGKNSMKKKAGET
jgi:hypothetical protein